MGLLWCLSVKIRDNMDRLTQLITMEQLARKDEKDGPPNKNCTRQAEPSTLPCNIWRCGSTDRTNKCT